MLLAVDVGNTQTHLGLWQGDELVHSWRIATRPLRTTDDLAVPHPRLAERRFALEPLVEIDPVLSLPDGRLLVALLEAVRDQAVWRLDGVQLR